MRAACSIAVIVGMALIAASFVWPSLVGGQKVWSEDQAKSYSKAAADLHRLTYESAAAQDAAQKASKGSPQATFGDSRLAEAAKNGAPVDPKAATAERMASELVAAQKAYDQQNSALKNAQATGHTTATILMWLGIIAAAIGAGGLAASGRNEREQTGRQP